MKKLILILLLHLASTAGYSQTKEGILRDLLTCYATERAMAYNTTYKLYKNAKTAKVFQTYEGRFIKDANNNTYAKINNTEYLGLPFLSTQVSHDEKLIVVANSSSQLSPAEALRSLLGSFNKGFFVDKTTHWEIELIAKPFSGSPYARIVLFVAKNYYLQKQVFYYATSINFSDDFSSPSNEYPRLEVEYGKPELKDVALTKLNSSRFFSLKGRSIELTPKYKGYQLIDQRSSN